MSKQQFPEPTVGAFIFNPKGELLLIKSHKWSNRYVVPGGHIELGEKMIDALKREIKEETDLDIYSIKPISIEESIFDKSYYKKRHFIFHNFVAKAKNSKVMLNDEAQNYVDM